jgi:hypothetical protein
MKTIIWLTVAILAGTVSVFGQGAGTALEFSGGPSILVPNPITTSQFTIEFWIKTTQTAGTGDHWWSGTGLVDGEVAGVTNDFGTSLLGSKFAFGTGGTSDHTAISTSDINDGKWHHVAGRRTSDNYIQVFVDGRLEHTVAGGSAPPTAPSQLRMGGLLTEANLFFEGFLDEVRIWNTTRTTEEIRNNMHVTLTGSEGGLIAYWRLDEGTGGVAKDDAGDNDGTLSGFSSDDWVSSSVPLGTGSSASLFGIQTGTRDFGTLIMEITDDFDSPTDVTVAGLSEGPATLPAGSSTVLSDRYWIVHAYGNVGTASANLTFTVPSTFTNNGSAQASLYVLYYRDVTDEGAWSVMLNGAASVTGTTATFNGITSFGQFAIGTDDPLPVQLTSFTASASRLNAELRWRTESEVENYGFEIERRRMDDGRRMMDGGMTNQRQDETTSQRPWVTVGFVQGAGTSTAPREYSFVDQPDQPGRYAYRIKQIDHSGSFAYTAAAEVEVGIAPMEFTLGQNYPNPFNPTTTIEFTLPEDGHVVLKVYDIAGREVATLLDQEMKAGVYQRAVFDAARLASGLYFARLQAGGQNVVRKMILLR